MKLDTVFKFLLLVVIIFTLQQIWPLYDLGNKLQNGTLLHFVNNELNKLYTNFCFKNVKKDMKIFYNEKYIIPKPCYFVFFIISAFFALVAKYLMNRISYPLGERWIPKKKWNERIRKIKVDRFNLMFFNLFYFSLISAFGFVALSYQSYFPSEMGGQGKLNDYFKGYPNQKTSNLIHLYYFLNGGYLLISVYSLLMSEKLPDFYENFLQHLCAVILVYFSYGQNFLRVGSIIMLCHDICEIFSSACRVFVDTRHKVVTVSSFCILFSSWGFLRLYIFAKRCILPIHRNFKIFNPFIGYEACIWLIFLLLVILLMNAYWFVLMAKMFIHFVSSGNTEDILTRVTELEEMERKKLKRG
ncbi:hypothetical protein, conserved [Plasmodium gonderi]|uniref:TLC domain-containing protein n=1 Tax=Plasmodium gonderi TaxID=77519 RepID=A0A1Y1JM69_PLAGO|nr:hypothetical protein, conserved [Plasmodium gonderi]GAW81473.1 hypothetical protein, conserved [Plasmodium gonderi]